MGTVRIEEVTGQVDDRLPSPVHHKSRLLRHRRDDRGLEIFLVRILHEFLYVFFVDNNCHSLLGLGDRDFRPVKSRILLRDLVEIDVQTARELANRDRDTARAEIIAFFDEMRSVRTSEKTLELSLCRRISLLDFSAAVLRRLLGVDFGGTCSTADAVTACPSAEQDDDIARIGVLTNDR